MRGGQTITEIRGLMHEGAGGQCLKLQKKKGKNKRVYALRGR